MFPADIRDVAHLEEESGFHYSRDLSEFFIDDVWPSEVSVVCVYDEVAVVGYYWSYLAARCFSQRGLFGYLVDLCERGVVGEWSNLHVDRLFSTKVVRQIFLGY